jgi:putative oxidoreductase
MQHIRRPGPYITSLFRIVVSLLFVCHGAKSLFGVLGGGHTMHVGAWPSWWAAMIELIAGALVFVGLFTLPAALLCSGTMAYAYFTVHAPKGLFPIENGGEAAAMFCWAFLIIAVVGAGPLSLDALLRHKYRQQKPAEVHSVRTGAGALVD